MLQSCQETIEKLGSQLGERREWRKQLASELELLREDLKTEKKVLGSQMCTSYRFALVSQEECCECSSLGSGQCSFGRICMFLKWDSLQGRDAFLTPENIHS